MFKLIYSLLFLLLFLACQKDDTPAPVFDAPSGPISYVIPIPENKLPWPQHRPNYDVDAYQDMIDDLWIINNFGQYQCGDEPNQCYFHDGLDLVLDNGTTVYAVDSGYVVANLGSAPYYKTLVIADANQPEYGWAYTHVYNFKVGVGDFVQQGQALAEVNFQGLDHIHLSRVKKDPDWENYNNFITIFPDDYFVIDDLDPPVIETPFHYFKNESDTPFTNENPINGAIDIVVGIRDPGFYSMSPDSGFGNRLGIKKLHFRILQGDIVVHEQASFDFSTMAFRFSTQRFQELLTVYKFHELIYGADLPENWDKFISYYIITNTTGESTGEINPADASLSWNTNELDETNQPIYPNGMYLVEVTAYDTHENKSVAIDSIWVEN